ncbi:hypothetical protein DL96DRAFT_1621592 [Flagelloscypha sp. PMI_526]|nr:hypothetical protein DL96DRAFT_1621592 [Flagelloscypha sp. PMI_526]
MVSPRLPPELEQRIFVEAAEADGRKTLSTLLLVARRVHEWLEPLLYSFLSLEPSSSSHKVATLSQKSASFLSTSISSVLLGSVSAGLDYLTWSYVFQLLKRTVGIQDLTLTGFVPMEHVSQMTALYPRLRILTLDHIATIAFQRFLSKNPEFIFPTLSHLDCSRLGFPTPDIVKCQLPALTHFMVEYQPSFITLVSALLSEIPQLERVVFRCRNRRMFNELSTYVGKDWMAHNRTRFVRIVVPEENTEALWRMKAFENFSLWQIAEDEVRR